MAATNVLSTMEGIFKRRYAKKVIRAYPEGLNFTLDIRFDPSSRPGDKFHTPVVLQHEMGFTFQKPGATTSWSLNAASVGVSKEAQVDGHEIILKSEVNYEAVIKALAKGEQAYVNTTRHLIQNCTDSFRTMIEVMTVYGQEDIGRVEAVAGDVVTITAATWSPLIWAGKIGAKVDVLTADLATERAASPGTVTVVNMEDRKITFGTVPTATAVGDRLFFDGGAIAGGTPDFHEAQGVVNAMSASGVVWSINNSTFELWKSPSVGAGSGQLQFPHIQQLCARIAEKGGIGGNIRLYTANLTWVDLITDQAALKRFENKDGTNTWTNGAEAIAFYTPTGKVEIVPSLVVKRGHAIMLDLATWSRIGGTDMIPGDPLDKRVFHRLEGKAGAEMRFYSNQAPFSNRLGRSGLITTIVNSSN